VIRSGFFQVNHRIRKSRGLKKFPISAVDDERGGDYRDSNAAAELSRPRSRADRRARPTCRGMRSSERLASRSRVLVGMSDEGPLLGVMGIPAGARRRSDPPRLCRPGTQRAVWAASCSGMATHEHAAPCWSDFVRAMGDTLLPSATARVGIERPQARCSRPTATITDDGSRPRWCWSIRRLRRRA